MYESKSVLEIKLSFSKKTAQLVKHTSIFSTQEN